MSVESFSEQRGRGRVPDWRLERASFAGRAARSVLLGLQAKPLPTPAAQEPLPQPVVWVVLRAREVGGEGIYRSWRAAAVHVSADGLVPPRSHARQAGEQVFAERALFYAWASQQELYHFMCAAAGRLA